MLQAGAFQQLASADRQKARLEGLGLHAVVKLQGVTGGTLHLVQTGPFHDGQQLADVEALLNHNSIPSLRIQLD
jgi:cell division protein FtsN